MCSIPGVFVALYEALTQLEEITTEPALRDLSFIVIDAYLGLGAVCPLRSLPLSSLSSLSVFISCRVLEQVSLPW